MSKRSMSKIKAVGTTVWKHKIVQNPHPKGKNIPYYEVEWLENPQVKQSGTTRKPKVITLLPKTTLQPGEGYGNQPLNVDGFSYANIYVISSPPGTKQACNLEVSFACFPFEDGVGVKGEAYSFFNFDSESYNKGIEVSHYRIATSDLNVDGHTESTYDFTSHILRTPILGPYLRAIAGNRDDGPRDVEVLAYLTP